MTYHSDPIMMQNQSFTDVIELYADLRRLQIRQEEEQEKQKTKKKPNIIRRRASDNAGWW